MHKGRTNKLRRPRLSLRATFMNQIRKAIIVCLRGSMVLFALRSMCRGRLADRV